MDLHGCNARMGVSWDLPSKELGKTAVQFIHFTSDFREMRGRNLNNDKFVEPQQIKLHVFHSRKTQTYTCNALKTYAIKGPCGTAITGLMITCVHDIQVIAVAHTQCSFHSRI